MPETDERVADPRPHGRMFGGGHQLNEVIFWMFLYDGLPRNRIERLLKLDGCYNEYNVNAVVLKYVICSF